MSEKLWTNILSALDAEVREYPVVTGHSGVDHTFTALAVDDKHRRLILISPNPDPKIAAMTQVDIQATMPDTRVLVARPIAIDLAGIARRVAEKLGSSKIDLSMKAMRRFNKRSKAQRGLVMNSLVEKAFEGMKDIFQNVSLPAMEQILTVILQSQYIGWNELWIEIQKDPKAADLSLSLEGLLKFDNLENDLRHGVCPIPLYQFKPEDWTLLTSEGNLGEVQARLKEMGIYQYFFPSPDELAVGLIERGQNTLEKVGRSLATTRELGHPFGENVLIAPGGEVEDPLRLLDMLRERGFAVEGEFAYELGAAGVTVRAVVKAMPKEGALSKVINRMNINVDADKIIDVVAKTTKGIVGS